MNKREKEELKKWVSIWQETGPELEKIRIEEIRNADTQRAIESLDSAFKLSIKKFPPKATSGLVEQQKLLHRIYP